MMAKPTKDKHDDGVFGIFDKDLEVHEEPIKYVASPPYDLLATDRRFLVLRRHEPGKTTALEYKDISSVEQKRLVNLKVLAAALVLLSLGAALLFIPQSASLAKGLLDWLDGMSVHVPATPKDFTFWAGAVIGAFGVAALAVFINSFPYRLVVYYSETGSLNLPLKMTRDSMELLSAMHEGIKKSSSLSKEEVERIIGDKVGDLLGARAQLEQRLVDELKAAAAEAKTPEARAEVKELFEKSVSKLEEQDAEIEQELRGTGVTREELFKKYRIKSPKQGFIDAIISDVQLSDLIKF